MDYGSYLVELTDSTARKMQGLCTYCGTQVTAETGHLPECAEDPTFAVHDACRSFFLRYMYKQDPETFAQKDFESGAGKTFIWLFRQLMADEFSEELGISITPQEMFNQK